MIQFPDSDPLLTYEYELRSRYSETDKMGYVYHGKFLEYFEVARVEMIRGYGIDYKSMEESGIMLPVLEANLEFKSPVFYDEPVTIQVMVYDKPGIRLKTYYNVLAKERNLTCVRGIVTLFFMNEKTRRPCRAPEYFTKPFLEQIKTNSE